MKIFHLYKFIFSLFLLCSINYQGFSKKNKKKIEVEGSGYATEASSSEETLNESEIESKKVLTEEELLRKIEIENALYRAKLEQQLAKEFAEARLEIERLKLEREKIALDYDLENEKARKAHIEAIRNLKDQRERILAEVDLEQAKAAKEMEKFNSEMLLSQQAMQKLKLEMDTMKGLLDQKGLKEELDKYVTIDTNTFYLDQPLQKDQSLIISDRRIELNGVITPWKANYVIDTIHFLNNKNNKFPIFIIIENSPGGSALSGSRILEAMHKSKAPVYVVLKGYAASMSAIITTLAKKSYAYPNAQILHHQPSGFAGYLNVRESKEFSRLIEKCHNRLLGPVAKKMGIALDELDKRFYENAVNGDWLEYADDAKKIKWIDEIVTDIKEPNLVKKPDPKDYTWKNYIEDYYRTGIIMQDDDYADIVFLPKLADNDFYYIYNPDNKYRLKE